MTTDAQQLSLKAPYVALEFYQGMTVPFTVTATDTAGDPIDLTGATVEMQIRRADGTLALTLATGGQGIVLTTPASGIMTVSPEVVGTGSLPVDVTMYTDMKVTLSSGVVYPFFRGTVVVYDNITA